MAGLALAGAGLGRQGLDAHALHERADVAPADLHAFARELPAQHASAHEGVLQVQLVDAAHERLVGLTDRPRQAIHRAAAHAQQLGLARDGQRVVSVDHGFALSNPALVSARSKKNVLQGQLANLGVQWGQVHRCRGLPAAAEDIGCALKQLPPPFGDLRRVQLELLAQLGHRLVLAQGCQSDSRLEGRTVRAPCRSRRFLDHRKLLLARPSSAQLCARSFHLSRCSVLRRHFCFGPHANGVQDMLTMMHLGAASKICRENHR